MGDDSVSNDGFEQLANDLCGTSAMVFISRLVSASLIFLPVMLLSAVALVTATSQLMKYQCKCSYLFRALIIALASSSSSLLLYVKSVLPCFTAFPLLVLLWAPFFNVTTYFSSCITLLVQVTTEHTDPVCYLLPSSSWSVFGLGHDGDSLVVSAVS